MLRHSFTTRLIFSCICSTRYHGEETLDDILEEFSKQAREVYFDGVVAARCACTFMAPYSALPQDQKTGKRFYLTCIGVKGDWPWLRKVPRF